jgi:hypothetical protein
MWSQVVGKTRLALSPTLPQWWHTALYVSARGLTTLSMPYQTRTLDVEFDFVDHVLRLRTSEGDTRTIALAPRSVAEFYHEYRDSLSSLGIEPKIYAVPVEVVEAIPFTKDRQHATYDADAAQRHWKILAQADRLFNEFRGRFLGKVSPSHFFWGSFDLAVTRFSGRTAPKHSGGIPNCPDYVMEEAYAYEVSSAGFWAGNEAFPEPAFYAYAYPTPDGFANAPVQPEEAYFHKELGEFILPYEAVRSSDAPDEKVRAFLQSTYEAAANLAHWDRGALERPSK